MIATRCWCSNVAHQQPFGVTGVQEAFPGAGGGL